jgi:hypothetical protein
MSVDIGSSIIEFATKTSSIIDKFPTVKQAMEDLFLVTQNTK